MKNTQHNIRMREVMKRNYYEHGGRERKMIRYYFTKYNLPPDFLDDCTTFDEKFLKLSRHAYQCKLQTQTEKMQTHNNKYKKMV